MNERYSLSSGPPELRELVIEATRTHTSVNLTEEGTTVAVIVPLAEFEEMQRVVDEADLAEAAAARASGGPWIPHEEAVAMLGLDTAPASSSTSGSTRTSQPSHKATNEGWMA